MEYSAEVRLPTDGRGVPTGVPIAFLKPFPEYWNTVVRSDRGFRHQPSTLWQLPASRRSGREARQSVRRRGSFADVRGVFLLPGRSEGQLLPLGD